MPVIRIGNPPHPISDSATPVRGVNYMPECLFRAIRSESAITVPICIHNIYRITDRRGVLSDITQYHSTATMQVSRYLGFFCAVLEKRQTRRTLPTTEHVQISKQLTIRCQNYTVLLPATISSTTGARRVVFDVWYHSSHQLPLLRSCVLLSAYLPR